MPAWVGFVRITSSPDECRRSSDCVACVSVVLHADRIDGVSASMMACGGATDEALGREGRRDHRRGGASERRPDGCSEEGASVLLTSHRRGSASGSGDRRNTSRGGGRCQPAEQVATRRPTATAGSTSSSPMPALRARRTDHRVSGRRLRPAVNVAAWLGLKHVMAQMQQRGGGSRTSSPRGGTARSDPYPSTSSDPWPSWASLGWPPPAPPRQDASTRLRSRLG